ncbi:MAG: PEP-CTERM sorting domain-containing protein [Nitrospiraceae bacterium]|nr:MAG: PEP-CTERM sorting domain-containing protein [Nitrospiraceae bacterium]
MKKTIFFNLLGIILLSFFVIGAVADKAQALVFDLNCVLSSSGCSGSPSWGTITLTNNGNKVDITVDLVDLIDSGKLKVLEVDLNYNDDLFSNSSAFDLGGSDKIKVDEDKIKADGYSTGKFDLQLPKKGNLGFEPYTGTIVLADTNLSPDDFNFMDTSGLLWAAVHIGNIDDAGNSIWIGSKNTVPEPGTIILLGTGLLGIGLYGRKRFKK